MPFCELQITKEQCESLSKFQVEHVAVDTCEGVLDLALPGLGVPDSYDRQYRVLVKEDALKSRLVLSFAIGAGRDSFEETCNPSKYQILKMGHAVQKYARKSPFEVAETIIEVWRNSTFITRSQDRLDDDPYYKKIRLDSDLAEARISVAINDRTYNSLLTKDWGAPDDPDRYWQWEKKLHHLAYLPNLLCSNQVYSNIIRPFITQTDIGVEVDFPNAKGNLVLPEERLYLAKAIEHYLDRTDVTKEGTGTIWIRQGCPETEVIPSS